MASRAQHASPDGGAEESGGAGLSGYVPVELLTTRPRFLADLRETLPAALDASESGRIVLQLLVGADGAVDGVVVESSGAHAAWHPQLRPASGGHEAAARPARRGTGQIPLAYGIQLCAAKRMRA